MKMRTNFERNFLFQKVRKININNIFKSCLALQLFFHIRKTTQTSILYMYV